MVEIDYDLLDQKKIEAAKKYRDKRIVEVPDTTSGRDMFDPVAAEEEISFNGLRTGFDDFDESATLGFKQDEIVLFGAETNLGKTAFSLHTAIAFACQGKKVVYFAAEDSKRWLSRMYSRIISRNRFVIGGKEYTFDDFADNLTFICEEQAIKFRTKKDELKDLIYTLHLAGKCDWFFIDMLNNVVDPLQDKSIEEFMSTLRTDSGAFHFSVWFNCRFREVDRGLSSAAQESETYVPPVSRFYGKSGYTYSATKIITLAPFEADPTRQTKTLRVLKNKEGLPGFDRYRYIVGWNRDLEFLENEWDGRTYIETDLIPKTERG